MNTKKKQFYNHILAFILALSVFLAISLTVKIKSTYRLPFIGVLFF